RRRAGNVAAELALLTCRRSRSIPRVVHPVAHASLRLRATLKYTSTRRLPRKNCTVASSNGSTRIFPTFRTRSSDNPVAATTTLIVHAQRLRPQEAPKAKRILPEVALGDRPPTSQETRRRRIAR